MASLSATSSASVSRLRRQVVRTLIPIHLLVLGAVPLGVAAVPILAAPGGAWRVLAWGIAPVVAVISFALACAVLSLPTRKAIVQGKYVRDLGHEIYGPRRLYSICWTALYYCPPVYHAVLAVPPLKRVVFRLFGYRGSLRATFYPDTWLRDLPLLEIEAGAYVSNKATVGTNMCLMDGDILVEPVRIERGAMIGHMTMLGPGARIGRNAEIGVGSAVGLRAEIGEGASIGGCCAISHAARIGAGARVGTRSFVGARARIASGVHLPSGSVVPDGARVDTETEALLYGPGNGSLREPLATGDARQSIEAAQ